MKGLIFVVQEHNASHLHYDLRLEVNGVLKSWAVPKEPPMEFGVRRLAIMVEDHNINYAGFEGVIPEGEYGAGSVKIWDKGTYAPFNKEEDVSDSLKNGSVKIVLDGKKLKGKYNLVRINKEKNDWLFFKDK
ncbi:DNA polymerase Ligase (LigD) [Candidatus Tiddalikarchaeum anstoanum]|nr:DNA polymerase Ligase (LigD) [Candidatus Tiddalikarchaeum anstoanum]